MSDERNSSTVEPTLVERVARALWETDCARWGDSVCGDMPQWDTDGTAYIAMAEEAIAVVRQWDAGK